MELTRRRHRWERVIRCRACGAWIVHVVTAAGRRLALNPHPHPDGTVVRTATIDAARAVPVVRILTREERDGYRNDRYRPHHLTCRRTRNR